MRNGGVRHQVAAAENEQAAQVAIGAQQAARRGEISLVKLRPDAAQLLRRIFATARNVEGVFVDIGGVDLDVVLAQLIAEVFRDQERNRISFFAGGAACRPGAK